MADAFDDKLFRYSTIRCFSLLDSLLVRALSIAAQSSRTNDSHYWQILNHLATASCSILKHFCNDPMGKEFQYALTLQLRVLQYKLGFDSSLGQFLLFSGGFFLFFLKKASTNVALCSYFLWRVFIF